MHKEICDYFFKEVKIKVQISVAIQYLHLKVQIFKIFYISIYKVIPLKFNLGPNGNHKCNGLIYVFHPTNTNLLNLLSNFFEMMVKDHNNFKMFPSQKCGCFMKNN
jgi:hypothetical protein